VTDCQALTTMLKDKNPTGRLGRWVAHLSQFNFEVQYKKGLLHRQADGLSRLPVFKAETEPSEQDICPPLCTLQDINHVRQLLADTLRHEPVCAQDGFISLSEITAMNEFKNIPRHTILAAAENRRFNIKQNANGEVFLKCHYGHSVKYPRLHNKSDVVPISKVPATLVHGTKEDSVTAHPQVGILSGGYTHVHFVPANHALLADTKKYYELYIVDTGSMARDGYKFFKSPDGVYTVPFEKTIPPKYIVSHELNIARMAAFKSPKNATCELRQITVQETLNEFRELGDIAKFQKNDPYCIKRIDYLKKGLLPQDDKEARKIILESADLELVNGVLCHKYYTKGKGPKAQRMITQVVIPSELVPDILQNLHDRNLAGHLSAEKVTSLANQHFYWEKMNSDIRNWCLTCHRCQQIKKSSRHYPSPLQHTLVPAPLYKWYIDLAVNLPTSKEGFRHFLIMVEAYSGFVVTKPLKTQTAEETATCIFQNLICTYGVPAEICSDNGKNFISTVTSHLYKTYGISHIRISPYHPRSNLAERFIQSIKQRLALQVCETQREWPDVLQAGTYALNATPSSARHYSAFFLLFSREPSFPYASVITTENQVSHCVQCILETITENAQFAREFAIKNLEESREYFRKHHALGARNAQYNVGDLVFVRDPTGAVGTSKKMNIKYRGPYQIVAKPTDVTVRLRSTHTMKTIQSSVHVDRLKPAISRHITPEGHVQIKTNAQEPDLNEDLSESLTDSDLETDPDQNNSDYDSMPELELNYETEHSLDPQANENSDYDSMPELELNFENEDTNASNDEYFEIDKILKQRINKNGIHEVLIKWKSGSPENKKHYVNSWEPVDNLNEIALEYLETNSVPFVGKKKKYEK
jgi:RNA:NAD 2'-phosphotransferase (TPT1/KptA family)